MATRIAIASLQQESNTFAPVPATVQTFADDYWLEGQAVLQLRGTATELGGFLDVFEAAGVDVVPIMAAHAVSGGPVRAHDFALLRDRIVGGLQAAGPLDAVALALHGATVVEDDDDGSGALLAAVRETVGDLPVAVTVDSHANLTARMVDCADILLSYRTYPHVDLDETGRRAARLLLELLAGRLRPTLALAKLAMLLPAESHPVGQEPMRTLWTEVDRLRQEGTIVDGGLCPVQPWLDLPDVGFGVLVVTDNNPIAARDAAVRLAHAVWARRHDFQTTLMEPHDAIQAALAIDGGPVVLSESADATGAGSPGDSTVVLRALQETRVSAPTFLTIVDPDAVAACVAAGAGGHVSIQVGGKRGRFSSPVLLEGIVLRTGPTQFTFTTGYTGTVARMGRTAVVQAGALHVVLTERPVFTADPALYRAVGLEPTTAKIVVVKSPAQFRAAYEPLARAIINLDSAGHSPPNLRRLPYTRRPRPCFPFEDPDDAPVRVWVTSPRTKPRGGTPHDS
jgi:microcystin degradation protein MlrC